MLTHEQPESISQRILHDATCSNLGIIYEKTHLNLRCMICNKQEGWLQKVFWSILIYNSWYLNNGANSFQGGHYF